MNYVSSVAERAIHSVDHLLNQAMTYAWTSALQRRCANRDLPFGFRTQPDGEGDFDGGEFFSPEAVASAEDERPF